MTFLWDGICCSVFIYCTISEYFKPQLIEHHLTISIQFIILDLRNPASPAAVKKRRQRLKMSQKKKMHRGKRKDFPRMQNAEWKPMRKVLNAGRLIMNV